MLGKLFIGLLAVIATNVALAYNINDCQADFCQSMVDQHNYYRRKHQANDLIMDDEINKSAQEYAEYLANENTGLEHSDSHYGENLAYKMDSQFSMDQETCKKLGVRMTDMWYNELYKPGYTFGRDYIPGTGHFTQVVWASSERIGCGIGVTSSGDTFYGVAQYDPSGNHIGSFAANVLAPKNR